MSTLKDYDPEIRAIESVGPKVGKELQFQAIYAIGLALLMLMIYIGFRFDQFYISPNGPTVPPTYNNFGKDEELAIPLILGIKINPNPFFVLSFEIGTRYTLTDNLDGSNTKDSGQIKKAITNSEYYNRWGKFYVDQLE